MEGSWFVTLIMAILSLVRGGRVRCLWKLRLRVKGRLGLDQSVRWPACPDPRGRPIVVLDGVTGSVFGLR